MAGARYVGASLSVVLLLLLCTLPCAPIDAADAARGKGKLKTTKTKSPDTTWLKRQHPSDPLKWFEQVNVHFKAGDKAKAADLLHDASRHFPRQPDMHFNHAYVRYDLGEFDIAVRVLEKLVKPTTKKGDSANSARVKAVATAVGSDVRGEQQVESKWVDLLIKAYVKVGRVGDAVQLTDQQLERIDSVKEPYVHARVALTVFPWRYGAAVWKGIGENHIHAQYLTNTSIHAHRSCTNTHTKTLACRRTQIMTLPAYIEAATVQLRV